MEQREIKFRGRKIDGGEWVVGHYYEHLPPLQCLSDEETEASKHYILNTGFADWNMPRDTDFLEIDVKTLGQFTGLEDKKGKMIFEGDICKVIYYNHSSPDAVFIQEVCFEKGTFTLKCEETELDEFRTNVPIYHCLPPNKIEVIGNIYENAELLKQTG